MAYFPAENTLLGQPIADNSTTQKAALGTIMRCKDATYGVGEFIYLKGVASTAVGSWVTYSLDDHSTVLTLASNSPDDPVAVAMSACVASEFGWYQISGKAVAKVSTGFADNGELYVTATAGECDDAVVAGDRVVHATGASAVGTPSAGLAEVEIRRPYVDQANAH